MKYSATTDEIYVYGVAS